MYPYDTLDLKLAIPHISIPQFKTCSDIFHDIASDFSSSIEEIEHFNEVP